MPHPVLDASLIVASLDVRWKSASLSRMTFALSRFASKYRPINTSWSPPAPRAIDEIINVTLRSHRSVQRRLIKEGDQRGTGRIFEQAQAETPFPLAPCASGGILIASSNARPQRRGTALTIPSAHTSGKFSPCETRDPHAATGNVPHAAAIPLMIIGTSVQGVRHPLMELKAVLEHRRLNALSPYKVDVWKAKLTISGLIDRYPHVPNGLCRGFRLDIPNIKVMQAPCNKESTITYEREFLSIIQSEISKGRYIGPLSANEVKILIGSFQSSPFSIIPKPGRPGRFHIIQNYSFPHDTSQKFPNPSINSYIDPDNFPSTWGTFHVLALTISRLPPGSQLAMRDIVEVYRTVPLHPCQWPGSVVRISDEHFCIDTCTCFGLRPSAGAYGVVVDTGLDLFRHQGIGPASRWVDNHLFIRILTEHLEAYNLQRQKWHKDIIERGQHQDGGRVWFGGHVFEDGTLEEFNKDCRFPIRDLSASSPRSPEDSHFSFNFADIDHTSDELGIPWGSAKDTHFAYANPYIGFMWDLAQNQVYLPKDKKDKYLLAIAEWQERETHVLRDVQRLYGKLLHTSLIITRGRAYLTALEAMLRIGYDHPFLPHHQVKNLPGDLEWWIILLRSHFVGHTVPKPITSLHDPAAFSDASGIGIAVVIGRRWQAWRLREGWRMLNRAKDIGWAEAVGFKLLIRHVIQLGGKERHFRLSETIKVLRDGETVVAGTQPSTQYSGTFSPSSMTSQLHTLSTRSSSQANIIQLMIHPEVFTPAQNSCSLKFPSTTTSNRSSSTHSPIVTAQSTPPHARTNLSSLQSLLVTIPAQIAITRPNTLAASPIPSTTSTIANGATKSCFNALLTIKPTPKPQPYGVGLVPTSPLRPHCSARDRLKCWVPIQTRSNRDVNGKILSVTEEDLERVLTVINQSWAQGTRECYGAGLLVFHIFCDGHAIPEEQRCPADTLTILNFISGCVGSYSGKTLANNVYAMRAWHTLHGQPWQVQPDQLKGAIDGAINFTPPTSKKLKHEPFTMKLILEIHPLLNLSSALDAAVYVCLMCTFYSLCQVGELTVTAMSTFHTNLHVTHSNVQMDAEDRNGLLVTKIHLPRTKTAPVTGEDVYWAQQEDQTDPKAALLNHFAVNNPASTYHLFAWIHPKYSLRPLSHTAFLKRIVEVAKRIGANNLKGYGLRIGGTLEYLLRGVPFNVVKLMGRWSSNTFTIYLRQHAMIMAPYLQESPILKPFTRYTMPPPC